MEAVVDDELNRMIANRRSAARKGPAGGGIKDNQCDLPAYLNRDIATITNEHINVALHRQNVDFSIVRMRTHCSAYMRGSTEGDTFCSHGRFGRGKRSLQFRHKLRIHCFRTADGEKFLGRRDDQIPHYFWGRRPYLREYSQPRNVPLLGALAVMRSPCRTKCSIMLAWSLSTMPL